MVLGIVTKEQTMRTISRTKKALIGLGISAAIAAPILLQAQDISIQVSVPQAIAQEVVDAFAWRFDYERNQEGSETRVEFAKRMVRDQIAQTYTMYEEHVASQAAGSAAAAAAHTAAQAITVQ
jgi:hypothetical protein